ncbi:MAG: DUF4105 domain-containing protein [Spirochaetaceae bacterium]|jgi:hypothetical protein|nr:DUF4105 domain-containing protein [Spirochaetaceae bacterium]
MKSCTARRRFIFGLFVLAVVLFFGPGAYSAGAQESRGDYLTIKIAVIGPGDELYFWWGHLGLLIEDRLSGERRFYDYGVFTFSGDDFISNFAFGRLWYTTTVSNADDIIFRYINDNRSVILYELNLSAEQKLKLYNLTERDIKPENRNYLYNHFTDNCVTRILNNLNTVLNGTFYEAAEATPGRLTLRGHVRRHTVAHPVWDWILNFLMGQVIDRPITAREEMFLPSEVGRFIETFNYPDSHGRPTQLVSSVEDVYFSSRPPVPELPWNNIPLTLTVGMFLAVFFIFISAMARTSRDLSSRLFGAGNVILGLIFGVIGSILFFMTFFTNHDYTFENSNVLFANPLLLIAIPCGITMALCGQSEKRRKSALILRVLWAYVFFACLLSVIIKLSPSYYQNNLFVLTVFIPVSCVLGILRFKQRN